MRVDAEVGEVDAEVVLLLVSIVDDVDILVELEVLHVLHMMGQFLPRKLVKARLFA